MKTFYLPHLNQSVPARESSGAQKKRGTVTATRFMVKYRAAWRRVYSDHALALPHFILVQGFRVYVSGVCP